MKAPANVLDPSQNFILRNYKIDQFKLPENKELVSGIYWVDFKGEFDNPITIEIEHCASLNQLNQFSSLSFVATESPTQEAMDYQLQPFPGGVFPQGSHNGSIQLSKSSFIAVVTTGSVTKSYRVMSYYIPKTPTTWHMDLIFMFDLEISIEVCLLSSALNMINYGQIKICCVSQLHFVYVADIECKQVLPKGSFKYFRTEGDLYWRRNVTRYS